MRHISAGALTEFAARLLVAARVDHDEAMLVARSLVGANLRGYDSHGVMRIPYYVQQVELGEAVPGAKLVVLTERESLLAADGNWGFGQTQATRLARRLIDKARQSGVAVGTLIRSCHVGRLGEYCEMAADAGLLSMVMVNTHGAGQRVAPPGGRAARLGTNPLAMGAPTDDGPLVLDFGTSVTAEGKVRVKRIAGELCPPGWLIDSEGRPTNDPNVLYTEPQGTILPMGGPQAYKGFGLALLIEVFTGALSGGVTARAKPTTQIGNCVFMQVLDPAAFGGGEHYVAEVVQLARYVRDCPPIGGVEEILLPGDPERRTLARRLADGIPVDDGNWAELVKLGARLGVDIPQ